MVSKILGHIRGAIGGDIALNLKCKEYIGLRVSRNRGHLSGGPHCQLHIAVYIGCPRFMETVEYVWLCGSGYWGM